MLCGFGRNDILRGLAGNDLLIGGAGSDTLDGGPGVDTAETDAHDLCSASSGGAAVSQCSAQREVKPEGFVERAHERRPERANPCSEAFDGHGPNLLGLSLRVA